MKQFLKLIPGLLVALIVASLSVWLSGFNSFLGNATVALLLGMVLGNLLRRQKRIAPGLAFTEKVVLETAIVLIGFGLNTRIFSQLGWGSWAFVGLSVLLVLVLALLVSRWFGLSGKLGVLLGAGSAICGSAAIGAVSPLLHSKEEETGLSIGVINLLSTAGLLLLPLLAASLGFSAENSGLMIGGVLQSMGHVVGAGFSVSTEVGTLATVVKMGRVLLLIPLLLALFVVGRKNDEKGGKTAFPWFVPLFVLSLLLAQLPAFPKELSANLAQAGDYLLVGAMVGIGFKIKIRSLFKMAGPALLAGLLVFLFQVLLYVGYLML